MHIPIQPLNDNPGSPVLVFGSALGTRTTLWSAVAARLRDDFQLYAADLPGHTSPGQTVPAEFTVSELASGLIASLAEAGVDSFGYCGVSISSAIGLTLALEHPESLTGLVACATAGRFGTAESWAERMDTVRTSGTAALVDDTADRWFAAGFLEEDLATGHLLLADLALVDDTAYLACARAISAFDITSSLSAITTPTLFLAGAQDPGCTPESIEEMARAVPGAEFSVIPDAAHLPMAEHPELLADRLGEFFTRG